MDDLGLLSIGWASELPLLILDTHFLILYGSKGLLSKNNGTTFMAGLMPV